MGRTNRTQVALYLDERQYKALKKAAEAAGATQQDVMRLALEEVLRQRYEWIRERVGSSPVTILRKKHKP
jgi:hypothetical protein